MPDLGHLLIVEDTPSLARTYQAHLRHEFSEISIADTGAKAISAVEAKTPDCILLDLKLPDANGLDLLDRWTTESINCPIVVITANGSMSVAVDAMRRGAVDFIVKPTTKDRLRTTAENAVENFQLKEVVKAIEPVSNRSDFCGIIGKSLVMQGVFKSIEAAAPSKASVFVTGETGTGKELIARAVHDLSPRRKAKFVAINCGAIPRDLIESEIFGHVKGAFTGATSDRAGAAELAEGGTLFLDELGEMPIELQPKLLRFLQLGEYQRVGDSVTRKSNIRIVAATNRDALEAVRTGRLREDLYYRLHVIPVALPPLRDRGADILLLAERFLARYADEEGKAFDGFTRDAEEWMVSHAWPGNVRELENLVRQVVVLKTGGEITRSDMPSPQSAAASTPTQQPPVQSATVVRSEMSTEPDYGVEPLWVTEKRAIERAIALCRGNIVAAAKQLQINPSTIYRKKASWGES
ncbi:MAG: sigma-54 dependent transcriptional regulator [Pseudomonadota bacterium]